MNLYLHTLLTRLLILSIVVIMPIELTTCKADIILSSFDSNLDGWTGSAGGNVTFQSSGGNPGGFLQQADVDLNDMFVLAPSRYLGDRRAFLGGTISFDARHVGGEGALYPPFGIVTFRNGVHFVSADIVAPGNPTSDWQSFGVNVNSTTFGTTDTSLTFILSNLTSIEVTLESRVGSVEITGFDNFQLATVPEPSSVCLLGLCIVALILAQTTRMRSYVSLLHHLFIGSARISSPCSCERGTTER